MDETGPDTTRRVGVRADHYAAEHGLTPGAVRKRIERGQLEAYKGAGGRWFVLGPVPHDSGRDTRQDTRQDGGQDATGITVRAQAIALNNLIAPYVERIEHQAERIGRLEAERDAALARVAALERPKVAWWRRLFGRE